MGRAAAAASAHLSSTTLVGHRCVGCLYRGAGNAGWCGPVEFAADEVGR